MTKRILALVMAVLFALTCTMLVACGSDTTTEAPESEAPASTPSSGGEATPTPTPDEETPTPTPTPEPTPTPVNEPEPKWGKEWLEWLTMEDMGESGLYTLVYGGGLYVGCDYDGGEGPMTISAWEIWPYTPAEKKAEDNSHFHLCLKLNQSEIDAFTGIGTEDYAYTWKTYYRPADSDEEYKMVEGTPWGTCPIGEDMIYRYNLMDFGAEMSLNEDGSTRTYHMIFFILDKNTGDIVVWNDQMVDWTDASQAYYNDAVELGLINKAA